MPTALRHSYHPLVYEKNKNPDDNNNNNKTATVHVYHTRETRFFDLHSTIIDKYLIFIFNQWYEQVLYHGFYHDVDNNLHRGFYLSTVVLCTYKIVSIMLSVDNI